MVTALTLIAVLALHGIVPSLYGSFDSADALREHMKSIGCVGGVKVLPNLPTLTLTDSGVLAVPNGWMPLRERMIEAASGSQNACASVAVALESGLYDSDIVAHIAYGFTTPDALVRPASATVSPTNGTGTNRKNAVTVCTVEEYRARQKAADKANKATETEA
jgi:hypothetical protein